MKKLVKKGFTLVELLVVIAVLAILASVTVVMYFGFVDNANESKATSELTQVKTLVLAEVALDEEGDLLTLNEENKLELVVSSEDADINTAFREVLGEDISTLTGTFAFYNSNKLATAVLDGSTYVVTFDGLGYTPDPTNEPDISAYWNVLTGEISNTLPTIGA